jgi:predicted nucleic acid-binding protein
MAEIPSAYFDACIFIELLQQKKPDRFEACEALHDQAKNKKLIIVTSAATITEVNKLPETEALLEEQSRKILDFFEHSYIAVRSLDRQIAEYAHELTRTHGLHTLDAIHVATAVLNKVSVFYTYDASKGRRKGLLRHHLKIGNPPLRIEQPPKPCPGPLFERMQEA